MSSACVMEYHDYHISDCELDGYKCPNCERENRWKL